MRFIPYPSACPPAYIAEVLGVPVRTARYWRAQGRMPESFGRLLQIAHDPDLGFLDERWRGYKLRDGELQTPEGRSISIGDINALPLLKDLQLYYRLRDEKPAQYLMEF